MLRRKCVFFLNILTAFFLLSCDEQSETQRIPEGTRSSLLIDPTEQSGSLDERFAGFAFDTAQLTGGMWWHAGSEERGVAETPDLESPKLRRLASQLAPSLMRIGGTDCDGVYYCPEAGSCELPESYQNTFQAEHRLETVFTQEAIRRSADFAEASGAEILFCLNVGPGPRDPDTGAWTPDNARTLLQYIGTLENSQVFTIWEPGNEINVALYNFNLTHPLTPEVFADDIELLRDLIDTEAPGTRLVAPGSYVTPMQEFPAMTVPLFDEFEGRGQNPIDVLTWHLYATQSSSCFFQIHDATLENLFDDSIIDTHRGLAREMSDAARGRPVWNTESASAQCGGQAGVSDTLLDALWYADWFGIMAQEGTSLVIRHSLVGADYSLLEPDSFDPRPTFLALVQMRRLVAHARLESQSERTVLKMHAFCSARQAGSITVLASNPTIEQRVIEISAGESAITAARQWILSSDEGLSGQSATINGEQPVDDGTIPDPAGHPVVVSEGLAYAISPPESLVFVELDLSEPAAACLR